MSEIDHGSGSHDVSNCSVCRKKMTDAENKALITALEAENEELGLQLGLLEAKCGMFVDLKGKKVGLTIFEQKDHYEKAADNFLDQLHDVIDEVVKGRERIDELEGAVKHAIERLRYVETLPDRLESDGTIEFLIQALKKTESKEAENDKNND